MKSTLMLAGALLTGGPAMAASTPAMPAICKTAINYAAAALDLRFSDGTFADRYNPSSVRLRKNFAAYPIASVAYVGDCEEDTTNVKAEWCQVAGGPAVVFRAEVNKKYQEATIPFATVTVTYNRGGCWVDAVDTKMHTGS